MDDNAIIEQIIFSLKNYCLRDIVKISKMDTVLASFILCSCFIEQVSGFRYAEIKHKTGKEMFNNFVKDYLTGYDDKKLREDLRNKLVHNYSLGTSYALVMQHRELHLQPCSKNQLYLNLENFIDDLTNAFNKYSNELRSDIVIRKNALVWYRKHKIISLA